MAIPTKTDLQKLDYSCFGEPYVQVGSKSGVELDGLEYSFFGEPFWGVGVDGGASDSVKILPNLSAVKVCAGIDASAVRITPLGGKL
jgi:hypothetical protein